MNKHVIFVTVYSLAAAACLFFVEQSIGLSYVLKTLLKILLFLVVPLLYTRFILRQSGGMNVLKNLKARDLAFGLVVGIFSFASILITYKILGSYIDLASIASELRNKLGITPMNFIFVGLYITFVNSLLEEYFFRQFIFLGIFEHTPRFVSYGFSSLLFALYYMAIFAAWFSMPIILLSLLGLFIIGLVFNYMNARAGHFLNSWLAHAIADVAIILIGLRMFGII